MILKGHDGLQSRLGRFDSDPRLQNIKGLLPCAANRIQENRRFVGDFCFRVDIFPFLQTSVENELDSFLYVALVTSSSAIAM